MRSETIIAVATHQKLIGYRHKITCALNLTFAPSAHAICVHDIFILSPPPESRGRECKSPTCTLHAPENAHPRFQNHPVRSDFGDQRSCFYIHPSPLAVYRRDNMHHIQPLHLPLPLPLPPAAAEAAICAKFPLAPLCCACIDTPPAGPGA